jgi:hypothetical protein
LDLLPEQLNNEVNGKRYSAIANLLELIESMRCCQNCKHSQSYGCNNYERNEACFAHESYKNWEMKESK